MRIGKLFLALATPALAAAPATAAAPLTPTKPWNVHYELNSCSAQREYGDASNPIYLGLIPSPWGDTYTLLLARKGVGPRYAEELEGSIDFGEGSIKAWLMHYGTRDSVPLNVYKFRISSTEMAQAKLARSATFHLQGHPDQSFTLEVIPELLAKLDECTKDLQHYWNMTKAEQRNIATPVSGDIRSIFTNDDYPDEAYSRSQEGEAQFLLLIDEQGKVADCDVLKPSGIPALDGMGCQVLRERAKFKPAFDRNGKPMRSSYVTPPVDWLFPK